MNPNEFGVASGWYPDPLGLPQLRWWDGQGWAEHTSEARAPIVEQVSTTTAGYDAGAFSSRRAARERERVDFENDFEGNIDEGGESDVIYDLEPVPSRGETADEFRTGSKSEVGVVTMVAAEYGTDDTALTLETDDSAQGLFEMTLKEFEPPQERDLEASLDESWAAVSASGRGEISTGLGAVDSDRFRPPTRPLHSYTLSAWLLSVIPLLQLVTILLLVPVAGLGNNWPLVISAWIAPHLIAIGLAAHDRLSLVLWGHRNPASPRWALLMAVTYLIVRGRRVRRETGHGSPLLLIVGLSFAALFAGCVAIPGLVISVAPSFFVGEIETMVAADARASGANITVTCPESPPILLGDSTSCAGLRPDGETADILVSLNRQNGWISWQVDEWNGLLDE